MFHNVSHQVSLQKAVELVSASGCSPVTMLHYTAFSAFFSQRDLVAEYSAGESKNAAFLAPALVTAGEGGGFPETLILTDTIQELEHVAADIRTLKTGTRGIKDPVFLRDDEHIVREIQHLTKKPAIIVGTTNRIIDHLRRNNIELHHLKYLVIDSAGDQNRNYFDKDVLYISTKLTHHVCTAVFLRDYHRLDSLGDIVKRPIVSLRNTRHYTNGLQERTMKDLNEEHIKGKIVDFITAIKENEDPILLKSYQKLIKKNVPFHLRGYFSAFLLKSLSGKGAAPLSGGRGAMQTLFINIGKNRRVYPNDLSRFLQKALDLAPERIGPVKVLANYSFVDLHADAAAEAVKKLDGTTYRGKTITVNFARKRGERTDSSPQ